MGWQCEGRRVLCGPPLRGFFPAGVGVMSFVRPLFLIAALLGVSTSAGAEASPPAGPATATPTLTESAALAAGAAARQRGDLKEAITVLKAAWDELPESEAVVLALAMAYLADGNVTWAARVLSEHLDYHPEDCDARFLLAWVHVNGGMPDLAHDVLDAEPCEAPPEIRARAALLRAHLAHVEQRDEEARERLAEARRSPRIYQEDRLLLGELTRELEPLRQEPLATGRLELGLGYTSNGLAGSPVDTTAPESVGSVLSLIDARLRLTARRPASARAMVEGQLRSQRLTAAEARDLGFETGTLRAGVHLGRRSPAPLLAFATDATRLVGGDRYDSGPLWFSEAQRGEVELGLGESVVLFASGGRRRFRELGRVRTEGELSLGWVAAGPRGIKAIGGSSIRAHDARNDAYDLVGASAVTQLWAPVVSGLELSALVATSADAYPASEGYFGGAQGSARRDFLLRLGAGLWSARSRPLRAGVSFEWTRRTSSAESYDYADSRGMVRLEWRFDSDTLGRQAVGGTGRPRFEYGVFAKAEEGELGEVRELMRQDEAAQRGASCLR